MRHGAICQLDALPAIVAVHRVIAAHHRGDFSDAQLPHFLLQLADEIAAAVWRSVAAVHEAVHENFFYLVLLGHFQQRKQMVDVRMHAAIAEQTQKMQLALPAAIHGLLKQRHLVQLFVGDQQIHTRDIHVHHAPRAHVHVAHFAVAHLSLGQAHRWAGCLDQRVRKFAQQFVVVRFPGQGNCVALRFRAVSPSIQHCQHNRFWSFRHGFSLSALFLIAS